MKEQNNHCQQLLQQTHSQPNIAKDQIFKASYFNQDHYLFSDNCLKAVIFSWITPLLSYGSRFHLQEKAVPQLRPQHKPKVDFTRLSEAFESTKKSKVQGWTLTKSIYKAFRKQINLILLFSIIKTGLQMYSPILSHDIISYISSQQKDTVTSIGYFIGILLVTLLMALDTSYLFFYFGVLGFNLSNTLSLLVYNKALKHPLITQKKFTIGDIVNYSQVDAQRMTYMGFQMVALLFTPIQIIIGLYLLYVFIGPSFLMGTAIMIILMIFTLIFSKVASKYNDKLLKAKDRRMKAVQQILQIIKFIKINALQKYFFQRLNKKRQKQLGLIKNVNTCYVVNTFVYWLCPPLIVSATFLLYVYEGNQITAAKAFITIIIFNILQYPMRLFPTSISAFIQMWSSIKRIQTFLHSSQIDHNLIQSNNYNGQDYAVEISHGYFLWGKQKEDQENQKKQKKIKNDSSSLSEQEQLSPRFKGKRGQRMMKSNQKKQSSSTDDIENINNEDPYSQSFLSQVSSVYLQRQAPLQINPKPEQAQKSRFIKALQDINIKIPAGKITMIIGDIGSGKTSLLYAILNEMTPQPMRNPSIKVFGSIAFAPQKPWIMAGTVRENILFFNPYNEEKFKEAVYHACLEDDIKLFTNGFDTQIGEKGVNLSGGQKARISLARTLYGDKDIYLLDDILSAVDVNVGKFLMEKTVMGYLRNKTVIMPTHAVKYLQMADNIIIMKKGRIFTSGPLKYVRECSQFQEILRHQKKKEEQQQDHENEQNKEEQKIKNNQKVVKSVYQSFASVKSQQNVAVPVETVQKIVEQLVMPQDHKIGKVNKQIYWKYIQNNGGIIFLASVLVCLSVWAVLSTLSNIEIKRWCEDQNKAQSHLYYYLGFAITATLFSGIQSYILVLSGVKQGRALHKQITKALLYTSLTKFYNRVPLGRILNRLSKDLRQLDQTIGFTVGGTLVNCFCLITSLTMCIYGSTPWMILPILLTGFCCIKIKNFYLKSQRQCVRLENITNSPIVSGFTSAINGVGTIRAYKLESEFLNHQMSKVEVNKRMKVSRSAMESWFALRLTFLSFFVNMTAIGFCLLGGNHSASIAGLLLTYSTVLSDDIINVAFTYASLQLKMISVERVTNFTEIEPETGYVEYCQKWRTKEEGCDLNAISQGKIQFKNYSANYRQQLPFVIKNVSIKISAGDKVGIVGRTGAGKSTLINCILRILQPARGTILIDDKDIMEYRVKDLRSCMTMIEQEPTLMNGTFRDNLDPCSIYHDDEIEGVLEECNLLEMVQQKGGINSKVSNQNLSVGQKQLLCICRAFLKKSKIILVDEATANIDVKNDHLIQKLISQKFKESTVLTIAHRLSTLKDCDKILVLGEGRVLEWGSAIELMGSDSIYRKMCESNDKSYFI